MLTVKVPDWYLSEPGAIDKTGELVSRCGRHVTVIAGRTAWEIVGPACSTSLAAWRCDQTVLFLEGYPSVAAVRRLAEGALKAGAEVVLAVGGGKVCDAAKAVGNVIGVPIVAVPTVAATCAAWAARSILYTEEGAFDHTRWNERCPVTVIADTDVLMSAPRRYLGAGILDTLAKWYEFSPMFESDTGDVVANRKVTISKLAFDLLKRRGPDVFSGHDVSGEAQRAVIDAILFLAGDTGSFSTGTKARRGFAHSFYFTSTKVASTRSLLHGEKVAFGLLVQSVLQGRQDLVDAHLDELATYHTDYTLEEWGLDEAAIERIARATYEDWPDVRVLPFVPDAGSVVSAMLQANALVKERRKEVVVHGA